MHDGVILVVLTHLHNITVQEAASTVNAVSPHQSIVTMQERKIDPMLKTVAACANRLVWQHLDKGAS